VVPRGLRKESSADGIGGKERLAGCLPRSYKHSAKMVERGGLSSRLNGKGNVMNSAKNLGKEHLLSRRDRGKGKSGRGDALENQEGRHVP